MIARSCSCNDNEPSDCGRNAIGASEARGGTEIRDASGALVGGRRDACGLHDEGFGSATLFLAAAAGSAFLAGRSSSRLVRALELVSVGFRGLLVVLRINVSWVVLVVSVVVVVAVLRFKLDRASVCPPFSFSSVGESAAEAGRDVFVRAEAEVRLSARLAAREGPCEDIATAPHLLDCRQVRRVLRIRICLLRGEVDIDSGARHEARLRFSLSGITLSLMLAIVLGRARYEASNIHQNQPLNLI